MNKVFRDIFVKIFEANIFQIRYTKCKTITQLYA